MATFSGWGLSWMLQLFIREKRIGLLCHDLARRKSLDARSNEANKEVDLNSNAANFARAK